MGADVSDMTHAIDLIAARATSDSAPLMPIPDVEAEFAPPPPFYLMGLQLRPQSKEAANNNNGGD